MLRLRHSWKVVRSLIAVFRQQRVRHDALQRRLRPVRGAEAVVAGRETSHQLEAA